MVVELVAPVPDGEPAHAVRRTVASAIRPHQPRRPGTGRAGTSACFHTPRRWPASGAALGQNVAVGRAGEKPRKPRRRLDKVPKYEEPNSIPAAGLTGSSGGSFGSRYGHSADHHHEKPPNRFGAFVLRCLGMKPKA